MEREDKIRCGICGKTFSSLEELNRHHRIEHETGEQEIRGRDLSGERENITGSIERFGGEVHTRTHFRPDRLKIIE